MNAHTLVYPRPYVAALSRVGAALFGSLVLALASQIAVPLPFTNVPFTLQTFAIFFLGVCLGPKSACSSVLLYLTEGAFGLPVFALGSSGLALLFGLTGGFLLAFAPAAYLVGYLYEQRQWQRPGQLFFACVLANLVILTLGGLWMAPFVGLQAAWLLGVAPFLLTGLLKIVLFTLTVSIGQKLRQS